MTDESNCPVCMCARPPLANASPSLLATFVLVNAVTMGARALEDLCQAHSLIVHGMLDNLAPVLLHATGGIVADRETDKLWDALKRHGLHEVQCPVCNQKWLTRSLDDPRCPPCRDGACVS